MFCSYPPHYLLYYLNIYVHVMCARMCVQVFAPLGTCWGQRRMLSIYFCLQYNLSWGPTVNQKIATLARLPVSACPKLGLLQCVAMTRILLGGRGHLCKHPFSWNHVSSSLLSPVCTPPLCWSFSCHVCACVYISVLGYMSFTCDRKHSISLALAYFS